MLLLYTQAETLYPRPGMIESIKTRLWSLLSQKEVSLAMVYDHTGRILWHRGRSIHGKTIDEAEGFPKSDIRQTIAQGESLQKRDVVVMSSGTNLPQSARVLYIKSLLILPIEPNFFLYLDSGSRDGFREADCQVFKVLGEMLGELLAHILETSGAGTITGISPKMQRVRELMACYALEEEPVLLTGETGTGKSHIAALIHRHSGRKGRFVTVNTPSIPEGLFESELFGHTRGAFSGALDNRRGMVEEAAAGTLFLDEVSETPLSFQAKLLRFVETRRYRVLGEPGEKRADVRIITATNRDLAQEVREQRFRSDLFFRLNVLPIDLPPLRDRPEDIRDLVAENEALLRGKQISQGFWRVIEKHDWPGNVRELLQVLKRAGICLTKEPIGDEIRNILYGINELEPNHSGAKIQDTQRAIRDGACFWDSAWKLFLDREINRDQLRSMLGHWYNEQGSLKQLCNSLNIPETDYPRFVSTLHKYRLHPTQDP